MTIAKNQNLFINIFKQGSFYVAYCPVLDLSSCGKTKVKAIDMIREAIGIFVDDIANKSTKMEPLLQMGWEINKKKQLVAPEVFPMKMKFEYA